MQITGYSIVRELGRGGMATVYLAIQESFGREVALKVMAAGLAHDPAFSERFLREAKIVAQLVHPNIVTVYDVGISEGHHYLSMEFIPGEDLKHAANTLSLVRKCDVIRQVAQALDFARRKGYIHRDVKPENIRLQRNNGRVVLMDFGIAKAVDVHSGMTQTGTAVGTPHYMSPEQARGKRVDHRSDLYSLGIVFYWLLVGRVPFNADSAVAVGIKHITEAIPTLPSALGLLQPVLEKLLAKMPEKRFQNASELVAALTSLSPQELMRAEALLKQEQKQQPAVNEKAPFGDSVQVTARPDLVKRKPIKARSVAPVQKTPEVNSRAPEQVDYACVGSLSSWWPWLLGVSVAVLVAYVVYFQQVRLTGSPIGEQLLVDLGVVQARDTADSATKVPMTSPAETGKTLSLGKLEHAQTSLLSADVPSRSADQHEAADASSSTASKQQAAIDSTANASNIINNGDMNSAEYEQLVGAMQTVQEQLQTELASWETHMPELSALWQSSIDSPRLSGDESVKLSEQIVLQREEVRERLVALAESAQVAGDVDALRQWRELATHYFQENLADARWQSLESWLGQQKLIASLLDEADGYFAQDSLTEPGDENAFARYAQVLELDPNNLKARAGIDNIAQRYVVLAQAKLVNGNGSAAQRLIDWGRKLEPDLPDWDKLAQQVTAVQEKRVRLLAELDQADALRTAGAWVSPPENNAANILANVLAAAEQEPRVESVVASVSERQAMLTEDVSERLLLLASNKAFAEAEELLLQAQDLLPESPEFVTARAQLQEATLAALPKIEQVMIAATSQQLAANPAPPFSFSAERSIVIQFGYRNFNPEATLVQAVLYDGTQTLEIAQVPVVINGAEGSKQFTIERPVEGFTQGRYQIKLLLDGQALGDESFTVE